MRESEPPKRTTILVSSPQKPPTEVFQPLQEISQNYVNEVSAPSASLEGGLIQGDLEEDVEGEGEKEGRRSLGDTQRLSNGLDPHQASSAVPLVAPMTTTTVSTNHSPRSSALQESRPPTTLSDTPSSPAPSSPALPPNGLPTEQELTSAGEGSSSREVVVDDSVVRNRHESVRSISEETRELDDYLNRSSVTSVLTDSQISSMEMSVQNEGFERVASEESLEGGGAAEESVVRTALMLLLSSLLSCCYDITGSLLSCHSILLLSLLVILLL